MSLFRAALLVFLLVAGVAGSEEQVQSLYAQHFTNDDLQKYGGSSSGKSTDLKEDSQSSGRAQRPFLEVPPQKVKKYVIPYGRTARRIIIPVTFNRSITVPMLLDTGAPGMLISTKLAEKLGILENDEGNLMTLAGGIGGTTPAIFTIIDSIQVGEAEDTFIPTTISALDIPGFEGLVGMDFMGKYSMQLDSVRKAVILEELPKSPLRPAGHDESWWRNTFHRFKAMKDAWAEYRSQYRYKGAYTSQMKRVRKFIEKQYSRADYLYNRLKVYASEHSVPLEWR